MWDFGLFLFDFTMTSYKLFSNQVIVIANFEKNLISPGFILSFRKNAKSQRPCSKALGGMDKNFFFGGGVPKDPPLA